MANKKVLNQLWFFYISFLVLWVILIYGDTIVAFTQNKIFCYFRQGDVYTSDFILYYNNGILAWDALEKGINIYDGALQNQYLEKLTGFELKKIFYSQYPPYLFVMMMPMPLVSMPTAWCLWEIMGMVLLLITIGGLLKFSLEGRFTRIFTFAAVLASFPAWFSFRLGQIALLVYPAFIWYWIALLNKRWFTAGILGAFCLLKLQYAPILFLTGIFLGGIRFFMGYATMGMIYLLSSGFVLGWDNVIGYPQALKYGEISGKVTGVAPESQQNLRGQIVVLLQKDDSTVHIIAAVVWIIASLVMAYFWFKEAKTRKEEGPLDEKTSKYRFMTLASITTIVLLLSSPHTHKQDYLFMSLPIIWLMYVAIGQFPIKNAPIKGDFSRKTLLTLRYLMLGFPLYSWAFFLGSYYLPVVIQPFFAWAAILLIVVVIVIKKSGGLVKLANTRQESENV